MVDAIPEFREAFREMTIKQGENILLKCTLSSNSPVKVTWKLDDMDIVPHKRLDIQSHTNHFGDTISALNVTESRVEDGGVYKCIATNRVGNVTNSARINIWGKLLRYSL